MRRTPDASERVCEGRVCVVTGAGCGIGREYALLLAAQGARVVVNDLGGAVDGRGGDAGAAKLVVDEITARGGEAVVSTDDVSSWDGADRIVRGALETFGWKSGDGVQMFRIVRFSFTTPACCGSRRRI